MQKIAKFEKVSFEQFKKDFVKARVLKPMTKIIGNFEIPTHEEYADEEIKDIYDNIKLPKRSTKGSAGYDFFIPFDLKLGAGDNIVIPTGIRCEMDDEWVLNIYPRSGLGFKHQMRLFNSTAIIDQDYYYSDNEGHIMIKITHNSEIGDKMLKIESGNGFVQGIFLQYGITIDDNVDGIRNGGFGSTDSKK